MRRDAFGNSGWKNLKGLLKRAASRDTARSRRAADRRSGRWSLFVGLWLMTGHWWVYPVFWLLPWMTVWRVLNRLRAVAEHGGMQRSPDRRLTTHHVRQSFWRAVLDGAVQHRMAPGPPRRHRRAVLEPAASSTHELERCGYVTPGLEWPNYRSLWAHARSGSPRS